MENASLNRVIADVYDAVLEEDDWSAGLSSLLSFAGFQMGCVELVDYATGDYRIIAHHGYPDTLYVDPPDIDWVRADPWGNAVTGIDAHGVLIGSRILDPAQYQKSEFLAAVKSVDVPIHDLMASTMPIGDKALATVALYRRDDEQLVSECDVRSYSMVHKHVRRALSLSYQFTTLRDKLRVHAALTDELPYGVIGLSVNGSISFKNSLADEMLQDASCISAKCGRLHARWDLEDKLFQRAIQRALGSHLGQNGANGVEASSLLLHGPAGLRPWSVLISPVSKLAAERISLSSGGAVRAVVCISPHAPVSDLRVRHIASAYALTESESALLLALVNGESLKDVSRRTGRSVETLRSHLKSAFGKTQTRSQRELITLVLSAPPLRDAT